MNSDTWGRAYSICEMYFQNCGYTYNQSYLLVMCHSSMAFLQLLGDTILVRADFKGHDEVISFQLQVWFEALQKLKKTHIFLIIARKTI